MKCIVIGDSGVGKTSLVNRAINNTFSNRYKATIGADFLHKSFTSTNKDGLEEEVMFQLWDTAGRERFQGLGVAFYRGSDACLVCFDVTNKSSFEHVPNWVEEITVQTGGPLAISIVGTKVDLEGRAVSEARGRALAKELGCEYFEVSAKEDLHVQPLLQQTLRTFVNQPQPDDPIPVDLLLDEQPSTLTKIYNWLLSFVY
uniref:Uncharacterized protein n=1 Tax=Arcella intermedia TaxID=1963864 RepID=A0A6B2LIP0_9EUKA